MTNTQSINPSITGRGMQAQVNVNRPDELQSVLKYTGGEYPVSGDLSRVKFLRWAEFQHRSVWAAKGVRA